MTSPTDAPPGSSIAQALHALVAHVPPSREGAHADPMRRARALGRRAALRAAAMSGAMSLPPGPLGLLTVLPDLLALWRLQQQLVADIAAAFGQTSRLGPATMVACLFPPSRRAGSADATTPRGQRALIERAAASTLRQLLGKIAIRTTRRLGTRSLARWLPLLGALGLGACAYHETDRIAAEAVRRFSRARAIAPPPAAAF